MLTQLKLIERSHAHDDIRGRSRHEAMPADDKVQIGLVILMSNHPAERFHGLKTNDETGVLLFLGCPGLVFSLYRGDSGVMVSSGDRRDCMDLRASFSAIVTLVLKQRVGFFPIDTPWQTFNALEYHRTMTPLRFIIFRKCADSECLGVGPPNQRIPKNGDVYTIRVKQWGIVYSVHGCPQFSAETGTIEEPWI